MHRGGHHVAQPLTIAQDAMFSEAEELMERCTVTALVAMDRAARGRRQDL
jgi:hypothetical protein